MPRTLIADLHTKIGEKARIGGWVSVRRDQGKMVFFDFRDRTGSVQGVVLPSEELAIAVAKEVRAEYVVYAEGTVNARPPKNINPDVLNGNLELQVESLEIVSKAEIPFELGAEVNLDTYLDHHPYTLRNERSKEIFKLQETIIGAFRASLKTQDFTEFQAPAIVGGDAEGGAAAFEVEYHYEQKAYLATSPQFYKQIMVGVYERAFATPKVFRGEKHATPRHLNEYSSMDFEMGFINDHRDVMQVLENAVGAIFLAASEKHAVTLQKFNPDGLPLLPEKIPTLKLREAQELLEKEFGQHCVGEPDLEPEHEKRLCEWAKREHQSDFVFVTHYPVSKRPFYTYEDEADPGFTKSFDLLFRGLEITTGGQRIHNYELLVEKIKAKGLDPNKFFFYLEAFKVGMPPHGGSATGLERITARMLNLPNVKEATLFPRDLNRIDTLLSTDKKE
ncbi:MAG: aspartate--tRNA(Asn) ligase [Patescibacteria group bacterium]|nr:aspartate--tRNA(Asn) ligase [Patescibacteria group bacterium]